MIYLVPRYIFFTLLNPQNPRSLPLRSLLLLIALIKGNSTSMVSAEVIEILHLEDADDPVLAREGLLERVERRRFGGEARAADAVSGLAGGEHGLVVVVGHFVPGWGWCC